MPLNCDYNPENVDDSSFLWRILIAGKRLLSKKEYPNDRKHNFKAELMVI